MNLNIPFKDYIAQLAPKSNHSFSLNDLMGPFNIPASEALVEGLLVGHILEELSSLHRNSDAIDCVDVANAAVNLGCLEAEEFLHTAPLLLHHLQDLGLGPN